ncbi:MAG: DUF2284 domain-containing protein [Sumerlaeia bacterium]
MEVRERYVARLINKPDSIGLSEIKFIHTPQVFTTRATRLRCQYTCSMTRQSDTVPPHCPTAPEAREILDEYKFGLMIRREEPFGERDAGQVWREFYQQIMGMEAECLTRGYSRAFAIAIGNCLALHHDDSLRPCDYPGKSRPTLESLGIELKDTFDMLHWQKLLVREAGEPMQLFALLLLE